MTRLRAPEGYALIRVERDGAGLRFVPPIPADRCHKLLARVGGHWIAVKHLPRTFTMGQARFLAVPEKRR